MLIGNRAGLAIACALSVACGSSSGANHEDSTAGTSNASGGDSGNERGGASAMGNDGAGAPDMMAGAPSGKAGAAGSEEGGAAPQSMNEAGATSETGGTESGGSESGGSMNSGAAGAAGAPDVSMGGSAMAGAPGSDAGAPSEAGSGGTAANGGGGAGGTTSGCQSDLECAGAPVSVCETPFCNKQTGLCEAKSLPNDTPCDDDDACTQLDVCSLGQCVGKKPVVCGALDQCHDAGLCNAQTGQCSNPKKKDGTLCDDGDACTLKDSCTAGACGGASKVVCSAQDQCHAVGTCDSKTGTCSNPTVKDGLACDDGHACTLTDQCTAGSCGGTQSCTLTIDPDSLTLAPGAGQVYSAKLTGVVPNTVTWSIQEGSPLGGSIGAGTGKYTAPDTLATYHVVATSTADPAVSASAPVTITLTPVTVSLCPSKATLLPDDTLLFTPLVSGTGNAAVQWSTTGGSITKGGVFNPGGALGSFTITAQSQAEPAKKASAVVQTVKATLPSISGSVKYVGAKSGPIHVTITQGERAGTAVFAPGAYRIRGVDMGINQSVTVHAYMDTLGTGKYSVGADPYGVANIASFQGLDVTGLNITLVDPPPLVLGAVPGMMVSPFDGGALVRYGTVRDNQGSEQASEYHVYVDDTPSVGPLNNIDEIVIRAGAQSVASLRGLANGTDYYFAVAAALNGVEGPLLTSGPVTIGAPAGGHSISGTIAFPGLDVTGPMYAIAYDTVSEVLYAAGYTPGPGATQQAFTVPGLPDGDYRLGVVIDQNDDGEIGPHDPITLMNGGHHPFAIAGADLTGEDITVPSTWGDGEVTTHHSNDNAVPYQLDFRANWNTKLPISAWLDSGPAISAPADFGIELSDSSATLRRQAPLPKYVPKVGDQYTINVLYADGTVCDLPLQVSGVWGNLPTLLAPTTPGSGSAQPTFSWQVPTGAPKYYTYELDLGSNNNGWADWWRWGGPSSTTSVLYNVDGEAKQSALDTGVKYEWWLSAYDRFGNSTRSYAYFDLP